MARSRSTLSSNRLVRRALAAVMVVALSLVGLAFGQGVASASDCGGPLAAGEIRVVLVIDTGSSLSPTCMVVPENTTGAQLLARHASLAGVAAPRYAGSGLLCAIGGFPAASVCGERNAAGGFDYWAYFAGASGSWTYGNYNPFIKRLRDGDVEGWRFVTGAGDGKDPSPRLSPSGLFPPLSGPAAVVPQENPFGSGTASGPTSNAAAKPATTGTEDTSSSDLDGSSTSTSVVNTPDASLGVTVEVALASSSTNLASGQWISVAVVVALVAAFGTGAWVRTRRTR